MKGYSLFTSNYSQENTWICWHEVWHSFPTDHNYKDRLVSSTLPYPRNHWQAQKCITTDRYLFCTY